MLLADLPKALRRRWYVAMAGLIVTAGLAWVAYDKVPPSYTSTAEVLLLPPPTSVRDGGNPYLNLGGLDAAGDILSKAMSDDTTSQELKAAGAAGTFRVALDSAAAAPMVLVTAEAPSATASLMTLGLVLDRMPAMLADVQIRAKVPPNALITSTILTRTGDPVQSLKPVARAVAVAVGAGLALSLLATGLIDAFLIRRRTAVSARKGAAPSSPSSTTTRNAAGREGEPGAAAAEEPAGEGSSALALNSR